MVGVAAILHAPRPVRTVLSIWAGTPSRLSARSRPLALCHRIQKHFRMCRRIQPSSRVNGLRTSSSRVSPPALRVALPVVSRLVTGATLVRPPHLPHFLFESFDTLRRYSDPPLAIQSKA